LERKGRIGKGKGNGGEIRREREGKKKGEGKGKGEKISPTFWSKVTPVVQRPITYHTWQFIIFTITT